MYFIQFVFELLQYDCDIYLTQIVFYLDLCDVLDIKQHIVVRLIWTGLLFIFSNFLKLLKTFYILFRIDIINIRIPTGMVRYYNIIIVLAMHQI